jgi:hypothetical protein
MGITRNLALSSNGYEQVYMHCQAKNGPNGLPS